MTQLVFVGIVLSVIHFAVLPTLEAKRLTFGLTGYFPPVFTPVDEYGKPNFDIIGAYAQYLRDRNIDGVLVAGTTGEGPTLTVDDKKKLVDAWLDAAEPLGLAVIVQVGGIPDPDARELAKYSEERGVYAILTLPPLYFRPKTPKELVNFMEYIADAAPNTPLLYYDYPQKTDVNVNIVEFFRQATQKIPTFKGIKTEDFENALKVQYEVIDDQKIFIANALYVAPAAFVGFDCFILGELNYFATLIADIVKNAKNGNRNRSLQLYERLLELDDAISEDGDLAAQKEAMTLITGINVGDIRPPEMRLSDEQKTTLIRNLREKGLKVYNPSD